MSQDTVYISDVCSLPSELLCGAASEPIPGGALQGGVHTYAMPLRFRMCIQWMCVTHPVRGLLMYQRNPSPLRGSAPGPIPPPRPAPEWYFFGYLCDQCQQIFMVPDWVSSLEDLQRALHHGCHGGRDWDRERIRQLVNDVGIELMRKLVLSDVLKSESANRTASILSYYFEMLAQGVKQEFTRG